MKLFLKGGSCIEVSDKDYNCVVTPNKVGFTLIKKLGEIKPFEISGLFEDFIVPRVFVERIEL